MSYIQSTRARSRRARGEWRDTFAKEKVAFLGQVIGKDGIEADPSNVDAIKQMKAPADVSELRRFLGMVNQMDEYIPNHQQASERSTQ